MVGLEDLVAMEFRDPELVPEILPVDARLSIKAPVEGLLALFTRASAVAVSSIDKEMLAGTSSVLLEAVQATKDTAAYLRGTATDGDRTISIVMDAVTVRREGSVLVPAHRLRDILKLAPSPEALIEIVGTEATIRSGRALWTVQVTAGDALSVSLDTSRVRTAPLTLQSFGEALSAVAVAASRSGARDSLMQVQLRNAAFTACDGGRVHRARVADFDNTFNVAIPIGAVDEILKAIRASRETTGVFGYDERHITFETGNDRVVAQILHIPFPETVEQLLMGPAFQNHSTLRVDRQDLIDTIKRVRINSNPDSAAITLGVLPSKGDWELSVRARDQARNSSQETLECVFMGSDKAPELTLNHHYLIDLLEVYPGDTVFFKVGEDTKATRQPLMVEDDDIGFTGIVQQMYSLR